MIVRSVLGNSILIVHLPVMMVDGEAVEAGVIVPVLGQFMDRADYMMIMMPATSRRVIDTGDKLS